MKRSKKPLTFVAIAASIGALSLAVEACVYGPPNVQVETNVYGPPPDDVVTVQTDKKSEFTEKTIESRLATFEHMDFEDFSFSTNRKPQVKKLKIKAKKFAFLKIIFISKTNIKQIRICNAN